MKTYLLRGVPHSVAMDGWWLSSPPPRPRSPDQHQESPQWPARAGALVALIALADLLLWEVRPGLSLALFGLAVLGTGWLLADRRGTVGLVAAALLFLPVVDRVQALSLAFWLAGMGLGAAWIVQARWPGIGRVLLFLAQAILQPVRDVRALTPPASAPELAGAAKRAMLGWSLPLGLALLFLSLFLEANPLMQDWVAALTRFDTPALFQADRLAFWIGVGLLAWPFLRLPGFRQRLALGMAMPVSRPGLPQIVNAASVRRSLWLFNGVFALQTLSDLAILWGGASLPEGMSYAQYAHRGAYPLLFTALLAGAIALVARPFTDGNRMLKFALLAWMGQTIFLTFSSLIRLDSYISVYGLTHMRIAALIWMALVATGIGLVIWQVLRGVPARWLLTRCALLGVVTLYGCAFIPFAPIIARYNLTHPVVADTWYLCALDRAALPVIVAHEAETGEVLCTHRRPSLHPQTDWREWGFRDWRAMTSLSAIEKEARTQWPTF